MNYDRCVWYRWTDTRWLIKIKRWQTHLEDTRARTRWMLCVVNYSSCSKDCQKRLSDNGNSDDFLECWWWSSDATFGVKKPICGWKKNRSEETATTKLKVKVVYYDTFFCFCFLVYWSSAQDFSVWFGFSSTLLCLFAFRLLGVAYTLAHEQRKYSLRRRSVRDKWVYFISSLLSNYLYGAINNKIIHLWSCRV